MLLKFKWYKILTLKGNRNRHNSKRWVWQSIFIVLFMLRFQSDLEENHCLLMFLILIECF